MRVSLRIPDPLLERALTDLLRADGHELAPFEEPSHGPALRITGDDAGPPPPPGWAVLVLRRDAIANGMAARPGPDLEKALAAGSQATWFPPLDAHLLLRVLGGGRRSEAPEPEDHAPDLEGSPHGWLRIDPRAGLVLCASPEALDLLDLKPEDLPSALATVALPGRLREAVRDESEGLLSAEHLDGGRLCSWWTNRQGQRVLCLLRAPMNQGVQEARNQRSLARLGQMAATLAHEIRNPVASVAGALDLLESESDPAERAEILSMARARLTQMSSLLEQTLHLARPIEGPPERLEAQAVIRSAVSVAHLDPQFAETRIETRVPDEPVEIQAYMQLLIQALTNLLLNAAQAQGGKGVIRLSLDRHGRRAFIRVRDEGPGIAPEKREEIFKPFYTTKLSGTGLGLPEVRRAMEVTGGAVTVEDVDEGACICLELPLAKG